MSEQVETTPTTQGESDAESILSGTDNELTDIEEEQDSKDTAHSRKEEEATVK